MRHIDARNDRVQTLFEALIAAGSIFLLSGLVVFSTEDDHVRVPMRLDAEVVVRIARVPPEGVGHRTAPDAPGDHVGGVQGELRLK
jgi:hypothetical protein